MLSVLISFLALKIGRAGVHRVNLAQDTAQSEQSKEPQTSKNLGTLLASWTTAGLAGGTASKGTGCATGLDKYSLRTDKTAFNMSFNHITKQCEKGFLTKRQLTIQMGPGSNSYGPLENADWKVNQSMTYKITRKCPATLKLFYQNWCYGSQRRWWTWCPLVFLTFDWQKNAHASAGNFVYELQTPHVSLYVVRSSSKVS